MSAEQRIRVVLFYLSLIIFFAGLPFILSFALGYKFNPKNFKFTKTGLIVIKTQPTGALVYLNDKLFGEKTPATIGELMPGRYNVKIKLEKHYPWTGDAEVGPGKVSRLDKIILFPLRPNIKQVNRFQFSLFWLDHETGEIYYLSRDGRSIYKSNLEGEQLEKICDYLEILPKPKKWLLSEDKGKLLYFNQHQIGILYLKKTFQDVQPDQSFIINYPDVNIIDIFWHSDSYHLVLVSDRNIEVLEARPAGFTVNLVNLNKENTFSYYDVKTDTLYFIDTQPAADGNLYDNLYTVQLNTKLFVFQELMKLAPAFEKAKPKGTGRDREKK